MSEIEKAFDEFVESRNCKEQEIEPFEVFEAGAEWSGNLKQHSADERRQDAMLSERGLV